MFPNQNILLIRLRPIGDILFTGPAIHAVREAFPEAKISFLTFAEFAPLLEGFRDVNEVIALDRRPFRRWNPIGMLAEIVSVLRRLRRGKFGLVIDFQAYGETALLTRCSGAPQRWGSLYRPSRRWAYTRGIIRNERIHPADENLSFLRQCGLSHGPVANEFALPQSAVEEARRLFPELGLDPARPTLFVQPLTSSPHKNWPLASYQAVAEHWRSRGHQILFGGGPADRAALDPVRRAGFPVSAGAPLLVTAGLMKLSTLVLGGDTGLLHLAVALGKRVVMVKAYAGRCHPFQHPEWAVTPPGGRGHPVSTIETGAVIDACAQAFAEAR